MANGYRYWWQSLPDQNERNDKALQFAPIRFGLSKAELDSLSSQVTRLVNGVLCHVSDLPVFPQTSGGPTIAHLESRLPLAGEPLEKLLADCREIIKGIRHNGHPRQFGYVASPATPAGAFADLIASALNVNVTFLAIGAGGDEARKDGSALAGLNDRL